MEYYTEFKIPLKSGSVCKCNRGKKTSTSIVNTQFRGWVSEREVNVTTRVTQEASPVLVNFDLLWSGLLHNAFLYAYFKKTKPQLPNPCPGHRLLCSEMIFASTSLRVFLR